MQFAMSNFLYNPYGCNLCPINPWDRFSFMLRREMKGKCFLGGGSERRPSLVHQPEFTEDIHKE